MIWTDFFAHISMLEHTSWQNFALISYGLSLIAEVRSRYLDKEAFESLIFNAAVLQGRPRSWSL